MSETQNNQDSYQSRPEHRLHDTNEPLPSASPTTMAVSDQPDSNTGIPPTSRHHDATLGHTAGAGVTDEDNTTESRTAGTGVDGQQDNTTEGRTTGTGVDGQQDNSYFTTNASNNRVFNDSPTTQGRTTGTGVDGQQDNTTQDRNAGTGVDGQQCNTTQGRNAGTGVDDQQYKGRNAGTGVDDQQYKGRNGETGVDDQQCKGRNGETGVDDQQYKGRNAGTGVDAQQDNSYFTTNASNNRVFNDSTTAQGGGDQSDLPLGFPDMGDKIIGKTQKVVGKMTKNPELHDKGELRQSGGRAAVHGLARAPGPHD